MRFPKALRHLSLGVYELVHEARFLFYISSVKFALAFWNCDLEGLAPCPVRRD
jgi:hypothetical protein